MALVMENLNTRGFWNEFCLSTLCGIAVVGRLAATLLLARIFNCYLGDRYSPVIAAVKSLIDRFARD